MKKLFLLTLATLFIVIPITLDLVKGNEKLTNTAALILDDNFDSQLFTNEKKNINSNNETINSTNNQFSQRFTTLSSANSFLQNNSDITFVSSKLTTQYTHKLNHYSFNYTCRFINSTTSIRNQELNISTSSRSSSMTSLYESGTGCPNPPSYSFTTNYSISSTNKVLYFDSSRATITEIIIVYSKLPKLIDVKEEVIGRNNASFVVSYDLNGLNNTTLYARNIKKDTLVVTWQDRIDVNNGEIAYFYVPSLEHNTNYVFEVSINNSFLNSNFETIRLEYKTVFIESEILNVKLETRENNVSIEYLFELNDGLSEAEVFYEIYVESNPDQTSGIQSEGKKTITKEYTFVYKGLEFNTNYVLKIWLDKQDPFIENFKTEEEKPQGITKIDIINVVAFQEMAIITVNYIHNFGNGIIYSRIYESHTSLEDIPDFEVDQRFMYSLDGQYDVNISWLDPGVNYVFELVGHSVLEGQINKIIFHTQYDYSKSHITNIEGFIAGNGRTTILFNMETRNNIRGPIEYLYYVEDEVQEDFIWESFSDRDDGQHRESLIGLDPDKEYMMIMKVNNSNWAFGTIKNASDNIDEDDQTDAEISDVEVDIWRDMAWIDFTLTKNNGIGQIDFFFYKKDERPNNNWIDMGIRNEGFNTIPLIDLEIDEEYIVEIRIDFKNIYQVEFRT